MKVFGNYQIPDDLWYMILSYIDHTDKYKVSPYAPDEVLEASKPSNWTKEQIIQVAREAFSYYISQIK